MAILLGIGSLVIALVEPQDAGVQTGFVVSTIGVTAMVIGVHTVRSQRWGSATARAFGRGGAILGAVGTALMLYAVLAAGLTTTGVHLPALSLAQPDRGAFSTLSAPDAAQVPAPAPAAADDTAVEPPAAVPSDVAAPPTMGIVPADRREEQAAVAQGVGTLANTMRLRFGTGPFPPSLGVGLAAPYRIVLPDGTGLAPIPDDARVLYSVSADGSAWSVTVIGTTFGSVATYSSAVGTVAVD